MSSLFRTPFRCLARQSHHRLQTSSSNNGLLATTSCSSQRRSVSKPSTNPLPEPPAPLKSYQPTEATPKALQQAPNVARTWSTTQNPKPHAFNNPRFEQTKLELQPNSMSAMGMVAEDPVRMVNGRKAVCDGGGGPLGHPKIFINLDKPGAKACGYCGIKFEQAHAHH